MSKIKDVNFRNLIQIPSTTYATFGLYRYPAKFIPHVVAYTLKNYANPEMSVFDPFAGYGTVGVVSKLYGHDYELWDLNPMLKTLHKIAILQPKEIDITKMIKNMKSSEEIFIPKWSRMNYWFPGDFLPFLNKVWGYYHSLDNEHLKLILTIPLLKVTRSFSYDDQQRQKLSRSNRSQERINKLLHSDWESRFFQLLEQETTRVVNGIREYHELNPGKTKGVVRSGIDTFKEKLKSNRDILITSPPYLQSQEYIRQAKLDLFWLGESEERIRELSKLEIPYRNIEPFHINSKTFVKCEERIKEKHIRMVFDRYFWGVLGSFSRLQEKINDYMFLFVGHTSTRGKAIPIDQIFVEHLSELGWTHQETLMDKIVSRRLFSYDVNPATGLKDKRTSTENLVVLKRD